MTKQNDIIPTPLQTLIVWALVVRGGGALQKDLKPALKRADREALVGAGLVEKSTVGRAARVELTDRGWAWAGANTGAALPGNSTAGTVVLAGLLARLGGYLAVTDVALADMIRPVARQAAPAAPPAGAAGLAARLRGAYLAESGGAVNRRVRLAAVRARLADVPRGELDAALLALARDGAASLYRLDDPTEIGPDDAAAAIGVGVEMRHLLWLHH